METVSFRTPLPGRLIASGWGLAAGLAAGAAAFWQGMPRLCFWAGLGGIGAALGLWLWCGQTVRLSPHGLSRSGSRLLALQRVLCRRAVLSGACFATPLLRLAGCRLVVLFTLGRTVWLPPLAQKDAETLLQWLEQDT